MSAILTGNPESVYWQMKYLVQNLSNKKTYKTSTNELHNIIKAHEGDCEKYLLRVLLEEIDIKDSKVISGSKDIYKVQFLSQELTRISARCEFFKYFTEIIETIRVQNPTEFINDLIKCLKISFPLQLIIALAVALSKNDKIQLEGIKLLKIKMKEYFHFGKPQQLPMYCLHQLLYIIRNNQEFANDVFYQTQFVQFLIDSNPQSLEGVEISPITQVSFTEANKYIADNNIVQELGLLDYCDTIDPWELILDLDCATLNYETLLRVLKNFSNIKESKMAILICKIANNSAITEDKTNRFLGLVYEAESKGDLSVMKKELNEKKKHNLLSIDNFVKSFKELFSHLDWGMVFKNFDSPQFNIKDKKSFLFLMQLYNKMLSNLHDFPFQHLFKKWDNITAQIKFLEFAVNVDNDIIPFDLVHKKQPFIDAIQGIKNNVQNTLSIWTSIDLIETLVELSESKLQMRVRTLFDFPIKNCPEYLLLTLAQTNPRTGTFLLNELYSILLPTFLCPHVNSVPVLDRIWRVNPSLLIRGICELHSVDPNAMNLSRVLDITQDIRDTLLPIVSCDDYHFAVNLGILAGKRDFLHIDQWVAERIRNVGDDFIIPLLNYFEEQVVRPCQSINDSTQLEVLLERSQLNIEKLTILFENLLSSRTNDNRKITSRVRDMISRKYASVCEIFPHMVSPPSNNDEIEEAANTYFENMFSSRSTPEEIIEVMMKFKNSANQRETEIFACMVHNLLDEYRFFHKYPEKELNVTGILFGAMIENKLVEGVIEQIALKYVIEALKRTGKLLRFGQFALRQFQNRLKEWPQYVELLLEINNLKSHDPALYEDVKKIYDEIRMVNDETIAEQIQTPPSQIIEVTGPSVLPPQFSLDSNNSQGQSSLLEPPTFQPIGAGSLQPHPGNLKPQNSLSNISQIPKFDPNAFYEALSNSAAIGGQNPFKIKGGLPNLSMNPSANLSGFTPSNAPPFIPGPKQQPIPFQPPQQTLPIFSSSITSPVLAQGQSRKNTDDTSGMNISNSFSGMKLNIDAPAFVLKGAQQQLNKQQLPLIEPPKQPLIDTSKPLNPFLPKNQTFKLHDQIQNFQDNQNKGIQGNVLTDPKKDINEPKESDLEAPPSDIQDKINFILNNVSMQNLQEKIDNLKKCLPEEKHHKWFSRNLVQQRVASQINFQDLYLKVLTMLNIKNVTSLVLQECINSIKKLIQSTNLMNNSEEKKYLKNIGLFIGALTLAKNKPILTKDLDLKKIIIDSVYEDRMSVIIPFIRNILQSTVNTLVFKPSNPWISAILSLLSEIYHKEAELKLSMNIKLDFDLLSKALELDIQSVEPSHLIDMRVVQQQRSVAAAAAAAQQQQFTNAAALGTFRFQHDPTQVFRGPNMPNMPIMTIEPQPHPQDQASEMPGRSNNGTQPNNVLSSLVHVDPSIVPLGEKYGVDLQKLVGYAVHCAIKEILSPVVDRSVTIALITTRELVLKDFAFEKDEAKIVEAAKLMVEHLAGSLALVTCREPLRASFTNHLKEALQKSGSITPEDIDLILNVANKDNIELGCTLIRRAVIERALNKVGKDQAIIDGIDKRKIARNNSLEFKDEAFFSIFARMPEMLRPDSNGISDNQFRVYEDFAKISERSRQEAVSPNDHSNKEQHAGKSHPTQNVEEHMEEAKQSDIELLVSTCLEKNYTKDESLLMLTEIKTYVENNEFKNEECIICIEKILRCLGEKDLSLELVTEVLKIFEGINGGVKERVSNWLLKTHTQHMDNEELLFFILKKNVLPLIDYDEWLFTKLENEKLEKKMLSILNITIKKAIIEERCLSPLDIPRTLEAIKKASSDPKNPHANLLAEYISLVQNENMDNFQSIVEKHFAQWIVLNYQENPTQEQILTYFSQLDILGIVKSPQILSDFCRILIRLTVSNSFTPNNSEHLNYTFIDAFVKLIFVILNTFDFNKVECFRKVLDVLYEEIKEKHDKLETSFNQRPYYRMLISFLIALSSPEKFNSKTAVGLLLVIAETLEKLTPREYPGFAYAWLNLVSEKRFLPFMLKNSKYDSGKKYDSNYMQRWKKMRDLFVELFTFLKENIYPKSKIEDALKTFYEGTLRVCLVIFLDFPEFLCDFYYDFITALPDHCVQLRNLILTVFPKTQNPPDPFQKNLKVDLLPEVQQPPNIVSNYLTEIQSNGIKDDLDNYCNTKNVAIIDIVCVKMMNSRESIIGRDVINAKVINAVVLYIAELSLNKPGHSPVVLSHKDAIELFLKMTLTLSIESRDCLINAMFNQLRYPNYHTHFFSCIILYLFIECDKEIIQEQITRIILERLFVHRPHPWGLMITFIELIQNSRYEFASRPFIKKSPEIEKLFEFVLKSFRNANSGGHPEGGGGSGRPPHSQDLNSE